MYIDPIGSQERVLDAFKKAGFDTFDYSLEYLLDECDMFIDKDDYLERAKKLREYADKLGLTCNQSHSFMRYVTKGLSKEENDYRWNMTIRSIEMAGIMGAKYVVIHPFSSFSEEENIDMFKELLKVAKQNNIKIAIENMPAGFFSEEDGINSLLDKINDPDCVLCLDIGHAYMPKEKNTTAENIIYKCSKYLKCLHIQDNDKNHDSHTLPGLGLIDFDSVIAALRDVKYGGDLTFEVDGYIFNNFPNDRRDEALPIIYEAGKELLKKFSK